MRIYLCLLLLVLSACTVENANQVTGGSPVPPVDLSRALSNFEAAAVRYDSLISLLENQSEDSAFPVELRDYRAAETNKLEAGILEAVKESIEQLLSHKGLNPSLLESLKTLKTTLQSEETPTSALKTLTRFVVTSFIGDETDRERRRRIHQALREMRSELRERNPIDYSSRLPFDVLRAFGSSRFCPMLFEATTSCADFEILKECLRVETAKECSRGEMKLIDCSHLNTLPMQYRALCEWRIQLPPYHPMRTSGRTAMDHAMCKSPRPEDKTTKVGGKTWGLFHIGAWACAPKPRPVPENTYSCWEGKRCYEFSTTDAERFNMVKEEGCEDGSEIQKRPCPADREDLATGCRKFRDENNHNGRFYYNGGYPFNQGKEHHTYWGSFYRDQQRCINEGDSLTMHGMWESLWWVRGYEPIEGEGDIYIPPPTFSSGGAK